MRLNVFAFAAAVALIRSGGSVATGTLYGLVDGAVGGALFAWLYNLLRDRPAATR